MATRCGHIDREDYDIYCPSCPPKGGYNSGPRTSSSRYNADRDVARAAHVGPPGRCVALLVGVLIRGTTSSPSRYYADRDVARAAHVGPPGTRSPRVASSTISAQASLPPPRCVIRGTSASRTAEGLLMRFPAYWLRRPHLGASSSSTCARLPTCSSTMRWDPRRRKIGIYLFWWDYYHRRVHLQCQPLLPAQGLRLLGPPAGRWAESKPKMGLLRLRPWGAGIPGPSGRGVPATHGGVKPWQSP